MTSFSDVDRAHKQSSGHRAQIEESEVCGCFFCIAIFPPAEITEWVDYPVDTPEGREHELGTTALCPRCGIDSVIGSASGYPITREFLERMEARWFGMRREGGADGLAPRV